MRVALLPLGLALVVVTTSCGAEDAVTSPSDDSLTGRTVNLGCELYPGIDTGITPPPDFTPSFDCSPGAFEGDPDYRDFGGIEGRTAPLPSVPPGFAAASDYYEFNLDGEEQSVVGFALPLTEEVTDPSTLGFYSHVNGEWQRIASVSIVGGRAEGEFASVPPNLAVLRETP